MDINSFNCMRYILLLFLFYIWGNWGTDRISNVSKLIECQYHKFLLWSDDTAHIQAHCKAAPSYIYMPYAAISNKKLFSFTAVTDAGLKWSKEDRGYPPKQRASYIESQNVSLESTPTKLRYSKTWREWWDSGKKDCGLKRILEKWAAMTDCEAEGARE